jgi:sugar/nucleoside kinase (ribokinase family)
MPLTDPLVFTGSPVCIVGNINRDVKLANVPGSAALLEDGETSVAEVTETVGGGGANSACMAACLGAKVHFAGKTGADELGGQLAGAMEKLGVKMHLARDTACRTGTSVALNFRNGHRHFLSCLPNNETLRFEDIDLTALSGCAHLLRADVWFSQSMLEGGNQRLLAEARRRGLATSLDINFDPLWSTGAREEIARRKQLLGATLEWVDLAHGNVRELCEFTGSADLDTALRHLAESGVKEVVVHMGQEGSGYYTEGQLIREPAQMADRIVNSTGTGDLLSMCMILLHRRNDFSIQEKLSLSNAVVREFIEGRRAMIGVIG